MFDVDLFPRVHTGATSAEVGSLVRARRRFLDRRAWRRSAMCARRRAVPVQDETGLIGERVRLAREIHDLLAHTLGATSIQLTALDDQLAADGAGPHIRERVAALHRLVGEGLEEASDAVRALREPDLPLIVRLTRLCELHGVTLEVHGPPKTLPPDVTLALARIAQEALTNAEKHAPLAPIQGSLRFDDAGVEMCISNGRGESTPTAPLARSGGRHGLLGMRERVELIGGRLSVGPTAVGWRVVVGLAASRIDLP